MNLNLKSVREVDPARCDRAISMIRASGFSGPLLIKKRMKGFVNICRVCVTVKKKKGTNKYVSNATLRNGINYICWELKHVIVHVFCANVIIS